MISWSLDLAYVPLSVSVFEILITHFIVSLITQKRNSTPLLIKLAYKVAFLSLTQMVQGTCRCTYSMHLLPQMPKHCFLFIVYFYDPVTLIMFTQLYKVIAGTFDIYQNKTFLWQSYILIKPASLFKQILLYNIDDVLYNAVLSNSLNVYRLISCIWIQCSWHSSVHFVNRSSGPTVIICWIVKIDGARREFQDPVHAFQILSNPIMPSPAAH